MSRGARRVRRRVTSTGGVGETGRRLALAGALAVGLSAGAVASAAASTYPTAAGSTFATGADGWSSAGTSCNVDAVGSACTQTNLFDPGQGNPPGSIVSRTDVIVNALGVFIGQGAWRSPSFIAQQADRGGVLQYDRKLTISGTLSLSPSSSVATYLVDDSTGHAAPVGTETLTDADAQFGTHSVNLAPGSLAGGQRYHLELRATTSTSVAQLGVSGRIDVVYDNVKLVVDDAPPGGSGSPGGPGSPGTGSPGGTGATGGTVLHPPLSSSAIDALLSRLSIDVEVGRNPGGSYLPLKDCTIVGTAGNDVIKGTSGNDVICGLGGNDRIDGGRGRDVIDGGNGNDRLRGSGNRDFLVGLRGNDRLAGGSSADRLGGGRGSDRVSGGGGNDRLAGGSGRDRLSGGSGKDRLSGGRGNDRLAGGSGSDRMTGGSGNDRLNGGSGRDRISGGGGRDRIAARDRARDRVSGGRGRDRATVDLRRHVGRGRADRVRGVERIKG